jgi:hypothetical protein
MEFFVNRMSLVTTDIMLKKGLFVPAPSGKRFIQSIMSKESYTCDERT